jgi:hypothetical protein
MLISIKKPTDFYWIIIETIDQYRKNWGEGLGSLTIICLKFILLLFCIFFLLSFFSFFENNNFGKALSFCLQIFFSSKFSFFFWDSNLILSYKFWICSILSIFSLCASIWKMSVEPIFKFIVYFLYLVC